MYQVQIRLKGQLDERWSEWLDGLTITHTTENETLLAGPVVDQSALYGLMSKLRDLGLSLLALKVGDQVSAGEAGDPGPNGSIRPGAWSGHADQSIQRRE